MVRRSFRFSSKTALCLRRASAKPSEPQACFASVRLETERWGGVLLSGLRDGKVSFEKAMEAALRRTGFAPSLKSQIPGYLSELEAGLQTATRVQIPMAKDRIGVQVEKTSHSSWPFALQTLLGDGRPSGSNDRARQACESPEVIEKMVFAIDSWATAAVDGASQLGRSSLDIHALWTALGTLVPAIPTKGEASCRNIAAQLRGKERGDAIETWSSDRFRVGGIIYLQPYSDQAAWFRSPAHELAIVGPLNVHLRLYLNFRPAALTDGRRALWLMDETAALREEFAAAEKRLRECTA